MIEQFYDLSRPLLDADERALALCREQFARLEEIKEYNQLKMLKAFTDCRVGAAILWVPQATAWTTRGAESWRKCSLC